MSPGPAPTPRRRARSRSRRDQTEAWLPLVREMVAMGLGVWMLVWQTALEEQSQAALVTAGVSLILTPVVGAASRAIRRGREEDA